MTASALDTILLRPPLVIPAPPAPLRPLRLACGIEVDATGLAGTLFRPSEAPGEWWTNGHVLLHLAEPPEDRLRHPEHACVWPWSRQRRTWNPLSVQHARPAKEVSSSYRSVVFDDGRNRSAVAPRYAPFLRADGVTPAMRPRPIPRPVLGVDSAGAVVVVVMCLAGGYY